MWWQLTSFFWWGTVQIVFEAVIFLSIVRLQRQKSPSTRSKVKTLDSTLYSALTSTNHRAQGQCTPKKLPHLDKISKYNIIFFSKMILYYLKQGGLVALDCISCSWLRLLAEVSCKKVKIKLQTIRVIVQQGQQRDQCLRTSSSLKTRCAQLVS